MRRPVLPDFRISLWICLGLICSSASTARAASDTRLRDAVRAGDATTVQALIKQRVDVNAPEPDGATVLHWAAHLDDAASVDALLKAGAKPNVANTYGATPLLLAAENGNAAIVERLLKAGADPNLAMPSGETPLMTAARTGRVQAVAALIGAGANVNAKESMKGQTALMWALSGPHVDAVRLLIDKGADIHARSTAGYTPLMMAVRYNSFEAVKMLLDRGARLEEQAVDGTTPLIVAVVRGHVALAKFLLDKGANANADATGYTALHFAAGRWDSVEGHDYLDAPGEWNVFLGLRPAAKAELIKALLAHGADINAKLTKEPPRYGFSLVAGTAKGYTAGATAFFIAAMSRDPETMRLLAANGADTNLRSRNGSTPLMVAAGMGWMDAETLADEKDYVPAVEVCIELGADLDAANNQGMTAIHGAISGGFNKIIQRLASAGANVNLKNSRGQTPLKLALGYGAAGGNHIRENTAELLRKLGGKE